VKIGLYIEDYERSLKIISFLNEFFCENCLIYSYFSLNEIYEVPESLDALFLDTTLVLDDAFTKIKNAVSGQIIYRGR